MMSEMEGAAADQGHQMEGTGSGGHGMEPISSEGVPLATETRGGQPLEFHEEDGVKVFELTALRGRPRLARFLGISGSKSAHCSSFNSCLLMRSF
ncbi:MAG: hypothetical protein KJ064_27770 [Anaerolineae bacterium]|nr:hypothetical protein [Anaerolineae bacterium]